MSMQTPTGGRVLNPGKPIVRTVFRFSALVGRPGEGSPVLEDAVRCVVDWLSEKHPHALPETLAQGEPFSDLEGPSQLEVERVGQNWAARLRQPDTPYKERPAVAGRFWVSDLALTEGDDGLRFGCVVTCSSQPYDDPWITYTRPRICVDLADQLGLIDDLPLLRDPTWIGSEDELEPLTELLHHPNRRKPVVVVSGLEADQAELGEGYLIDPAKLAEGLYCLAHVVALPGDLARMWADQIGNLWAVFRGGVRVYEPGLDMEEQEPYAHPLTIAQRIRGWTWGGAEGPDAFARFQAEKCIEAALRVAETAGIPFLRELKTEAARRRSESAEKDSPEELAALRSALDALQRERDEYAELASQAMDDESRHKEEAARLRESNYRLQVTNDQLRTALEAAGASEPEVAQRPKAYSEVAEWVASRLAGRLTLHPRAVRGLKDARYQDLDLVLDALELLATSYRDMGMGKEGSRARFEDKARALRLGLEKSISDSRRGEEGETYEVKYPPNIGRAHTLEWHLTKGNSRDPAECLRIYFFFHEESNEVVVGWLPSHLDTRST